MKTDLISKQHQGEAYVIALSVIEAAFPLLALITVSALGALHAYLFSLLIATALLTLWVLVRRKTHELKRRQAYRDLLLTSFYITTVFTLVFVALLFTSPSHVMIILFLQVLFSYLFLGRSAGEKLHRIHLAGVVLMSFGALIILFPQDLKMNWGDLLVLFAAMLAPIANLYQKRARRHVSSETILLVRGLVALPIVFLLATWLEPQPSWSMVESQLLWLFLIGAFVFIVAKLLWIESLHRLPITKVNALFAFSPLITLILVYLFLHQAPTWTQLLGALPILIGSILITRSVKTA